MEGERQRYREHQQPIYVRLGLTAMLMHDEIVIASMIL